MTEVRPRRSMLYMPASNARAIEKARGLSVDGIILDLEDSVAPEAKARAREAVVEALRAGGFGRREVVIRTNGMATEWFAEDVAAALNARPDAILVPKIGSAAEVHALRRAGDPQVPLWAMIETPAGILNAGEIAAAKGESGPGLAAFVLGLNDLSKETGARQVPGRAPMLPWIATALIAARAAGLAILDAVYNDLADERGFLAECEQARDLGFDGKTLIHPQQVEIANRIFAPTPEEVAEAREIVALFEHPDNQGRGVVTRNGRMVERLHAKAAEKTLALAAAIDDRD